MLLSVMQIGQRVLRQLARLAPWILLALGVTAAPASAQAWISEYATFGSEPACQMVSYSQDGTRLSFNAPELDGGAILFMAINNDWPFKERVYAGDGHLATDHFTLAEQPLLTLDNGFLHIYTLDQLRDFIVAADGRPVRLVADGQLLGRYDGTGLLIAWGAFSECIYANFGGDSVMPRDPFVR